VPVAGSSVNGTTTFSGTATDTGGSGFDKVWVAIRDENSSQWYNFTDETFGAISQGGFDVGISNANLSNTTTTSTDWNFVATLPTGSYTIFALAIDNAGNDAFHGTGLAVWPTNNTFSITVADTTSPTISVSTPQVFIYLTNTSGQYWNGTTFQNSFARAPMNGTTDWSTTISLPDGTYFLQPLVFDSSNNFGSNDVELLFLMCRQLQQRSSLHSCKAPDTWMV